MSEAITLLTASNISKSFPGVKALNDVSLTLYRGEIHALVGENGAGKSTLMKILLGMYTRDAGRIVYKDEEVDYTSPEMALKSGISMIHQEISLIPTFDVAENIWLGQESKFSKFGVLNIAQRYKATKQLLEKLEIKLNPKQTVANLSVAQMQLVELARAVSYNADLIIMDEPTSALSREEIEKLYTIVRELSAKGTTIVFISHKLDEIYSICQRISVMRDGHMITTRNADELDVDELVSLIAGRDIDNSFPKVHAPHEEILLECRNLNVGKAVRDVSFSVKKGEIVGFCGLMGAGRTEVMRALFGIDRLESGQVFIEGRPVRIKSPQKAIACGLGMITEDRLRMGIVPYLSVKFNMSLAYLYNHCYRLGIVKRKAETVETTKIAKDLGVKTPGMEQQISLLSGGNQQKALIGRWLLTTPKLLILDEPTRGIDVGAKSEIYRLMGELAKQGMSIIMVSSELPEIIGMSDRAYVMHNGGIVAEVPGDKLEQDYLMRKAFGL